MISFVDRDAAVRVALDLLSGLEAQGGPTHPRMVYAAVQARKMLKVWGAAA